MFISYFYVNCNLWILLKSEATYYIINNYLLIIVLKKGWILIFLIFSLYFSTELFYNISELRNLSSGVMEWIKLCYGMKHLIS